MMFRIGVLTYNAISTLRCDLLERTVLSLRDAFAPHQGGWVSVLDNSSDDGSDDFVRQLEGCARLVIKSGDGNHTPGRGRNELMRCLTERRWNHRNDIVVLSDDDVRWRGHAGSQLERFWAAAPEDLVILSGLLEPDWPWNTPVKPIDHGGVPALERVSAPAAAWSFRLRDWDKIGPLKESLDGDGEDFDACKRLRAAGYRVAQADLAEHIGDGYSQLGNDKARTIAGRALDREKWGL